MRSAAIALAIFALAGCVRSSSVQCADGRVCPSTLVCDDAHAACVTPEQLTACNGLADGDRCTADGAPGTCDQGTCTDCGDGVQGAGEECDCGVAGAVLPNSCTAPNGEPTSGCSAVCELRFCGNSVVDPGEVCDDGNFDNSDACALDCQSNVTCGNGFTDAAIGESCDDGNLASHDGCSSNCTAEAALWRKWSSPFIARAQHGAAYDAMRKQLVVFGGTSPAGYESSVWERASTASVDTNRAWTQRTFGTLPTKRANPAMAYDPNRGVVVLFGGYAAVTATNDTWEYDGTQWTLATPLTSPPARFGAAMVFDTARNRIVMYGGRPASSSPASFLDDTWTWDGTNWSLLAATGPGGRSGHGLAYDDARDRVVLFGGFEPAAVRDDTWELPSSSPTWTQMTPAASPPPRYGAAMAYSADLGRTVLVGGISGLSYLSDTWEYNGSTWTPITTSSDVPKAGAATLTEDRDNQQLVLIGGVDDNGERDEVWEYDGEWLRQRPTLAPTPRLTPLTYDSVRRKVMLFSGSGSGNEVLSDLWAFDGTTWTALEQAGTRPAGRFFHVVAYHASTDKLLVYGGKRNIDAATIDDDRTWNGTSWSEVTGAAPPARFGAAVAYHEDDEVIVVYGGYDGAVQPQPLGDTWEFDGMAWTQITGSAGPPQQTFNSVAVSMTYDPIAKRIVAITNSGTYAYANRTWSMLTTTVPWSTRQYMQLTFDRGRGRVTAYGGQAPDQSAFYNDVWELAPTGWTHVATSGDPPIATVFAGWTGDPAHRQLVLFGGQTAIDARGETWTLQWRSSTPDEACVGGIDDDGDGLIDAADPDCQP